MISVETRGRVAVIQMMHGKANAMDTALCQDLVAHLGDLERGGHHVGDPIWPAPSEVFLPRLLEQEPIKLRGYPLVMVLAEKIITALQRGSASTRWRDFGDVYQLTGRHIFRAKELRQALRAVGDYRRVNLSSLDDALDGYVEIGQSRWAAWRRKLQLTDTLPADFADALGALEIFAEPILNGSAEDSASWDPARRGWF